MGEQRRTGTALLDRQRRHRRLDDRLAGPAAHLRAHMHDALEVGGDVFQHLALVGADPAELLAAAGRADAGRFVDDRLRAADDRARARGRTASSSSPRHGSRSAGSSIARTMSRPRSPRDRRSAVRAVRRADRAFPTTGRSARAAEPQAAFSASRSAASWREPRRKAPRHRVADRPQRGADRAGSWGKSVGVDDMPISITKRASTQLKTLCNRRFSNERRALARCWRDRPAPVDSFDQQRQLRRRQLQRAIHDRRPDELALLQPLGEQAQP